MTHHVGDPQVGEPLGQCCLEAVDLFGTLGRHDHPYRREPEPVTISDAGTLRGTEVVKVMLSGSPPALDAAQEEIRRRIPVMQRSMDRFYESSSPGATKREALRSVLGRIGVPPAQCMGFGDGDTDASWLSEVGTVVAVSNARESVQRLAHIRIGHHAEDAVATFLESRF